MATITAAADGNYSVGATWNGGSAPGANDIADLSGKNVTMDGNITVSQIQDNASTGGALVVPNGSNYTINGHLYSIRASGNMIIVGSAVAAALSVNGNITGAGSGGNCLAVGGAGTATVNGNTSSTNGTSAIYNSGSCTVTGNGSRTGSGSALYNNAGTSSFTGNVTCNCGFAAGGTLSCAGGTLTFVGDASSTDGTYGSVLSVTGGTLVWSGNRTLAAASVLAILITGGALNLSGWTLRNGGKFFLRKTSGTLTTDARTRIIEQSSLAQQTVLGGTIPVSRINQGGVFRSAA